MSPDNVKLVLNQDLEILAENESPTQRVDVISTINVVDTPMDLSTNFSLKSEMIEQE